jgi:hypothetical protein
VLLHQALGSVPRSIKDPVTTNEVNVSGFLNMLVASSEAKVNALYMLQVHLHTAIQSICQRLSRSSRPLSLRHY